MFNSGAKLQYFPQLTALHVSFFLIFARELEAKEEKMRIVVLTGAGMSAESGLSTFRDSDGLWNNYNVEDVATPEGWAREIGRASCRERV